jgi:hypothetical protein
MPGTSSLGSTVALPLPSAAGPRKLSYLARVGIWAVCISAPWIVAAQVVKLAF